MARSEKDRADNSRQMRSGDGSFIAPGCALEGDFSFAGPLTVAGRITGRLKCDGMVILETSGEVDGTIDAAIIIVHGKLSGDVLATESLEIWSGSEVRGTVHARSIRVDEGSLLTADLMISDVLPEKRLDLSAGRPAESGQQQPRQPVTNRPASPLPGSGLARKLASLEDNH